MQKSFFNTTRLSTEELLDAEGKALCQEVRVLNLFKKYPNSHIAPHEVHSAVGSSVSPLTSTRRAMTCLAKKGLLIKTMVKVDGEYGRESCTWVYNGKG